jgi:hypothetical protein
MKADLYRVFNEAVKDHAKYENSSGSAENTPFCPMIENRKAISALAEAIVAVEKEQREAKDRGYNKLEKN